MSDATHTQHPSGAPLSGRSVVITRPLAQAAALARPLEDLGAEVLALPVLEVVDPLDPSAIDAAIGELPSFDWVVLTSTNAVDRFFARLVFVDRSGEALTHVKLAAVGETTAARMRERGVEPDLVPASAGAEGLVAAFGEIGVGAGCRVLVPRAIEAREVLPDALRAMGAEVVVAPIYRVVPIEPDAANLQRLSEGTVDCVTFTSGAIARAFVDVLNRVGIDADAVMRRVAVASIGPVTTQALTALGYRADVEAPRATMASLAGAIAAHFASGSQA